MRRVLVGLGVAAGGMVALVGGLVWDALLHADDPTLAAREGVFTLDNPGHLLLVAGIVVAAVGVLLGGDAALTLRAGGPWAAAGARRAAMAGVVALALSAGGVVSWASTEAHDHAETPASAHGHEAGDHGGHDGPTDEQRAAADRLRSDTIASTRRWPTVAEAEAAGYQPITPVFNGIQHWHNDAFHRDGRVLDPQAPEELLYASTGRGRQVLVGAMYLMPKVGERGPTIGGSLTKWHDLTFRLWVAAQAMKR